MMACINVAVFVLISSLEKDHSMIEMRRLKNIVIFVQTIEMNLIDFPNDDNNSISYTFKQQLTGPTMAQMMSK